MYILVVEPKPSDYHLHIYDMNAPRHPTPIKTAATGHQTTLKELKSIGGYEGGWKITDSHLSPNNDRCGFLNG